MKAMLLAFASFAAFVPPVLAQDHLVPEPGMLGEPDGYMLKVRIVFSQAFTRDVKLRVIVLPSFVGEYAAGVTGGAGGSKAFALDPSSIIWRTEQIEMYENGSMREFDEKRNEIDFRESGTYKNLKKNYPSDCREIKTVKHEKPIPEEVADELRIVWEKALLAVKHSEKFGGGADGVTYHFSAFLKKRGDVSGQIWSPDEKLKIARLTKLTETLADYARGKADLDQLKKRIRDAK